MPAIRANRESIDDRFSVLGFTVRTESPLFEIGIATDPQLFRPENRVRRNRRNFFSTRGGGAIRARRGEAVYLVPADVLGNFVGQQKLYFGLATYPESNHGVPDSVKMPDTGSMYVNIGGLTERGLRRMRGNGSADYGGSSQADLEWGGDALPASAPPGRPGAEGGSAAPEYDDGFGPFRNDAAATAPAAETAHPAPAVAAALAVPLDPGVGGQSITEAALAPADVIVSTARHPVSYAIRAGTFSAISHAMIYVGDGRVVEAVGEGVREVPLAEAIGDAILAVAYRHAAATPAQTAAIVSYARSRIGSPYNYAGVAFTGYRLLHPLPARVIEGVASRLGLSVGQAGAVYCSELVFEAYEQAGLPLVAARPATSTPEDIVELSRSVLGYVGHLRGEDVPLGIPLALGTRPRRRGSRALADQCFSVHWDTVPYYPQSHQASCWAASAAMVMGWYTGQPITDDQIADKVPVIDRYKNGIWPNQRQILRDVWGLVAEPPASYTIDGWRRMLENNGPIYIDMTWNAAGGGHVRVLVGMDSDGAEDGSDTYMYLHDPWPGTPGRIKLSFADFLTLYEGRTENSGGILQYQILHAPDVPAHLRPALASPFALTLAAEAEPQDRAEGDFQLAPAPEPVVQQMQLRSRALVAPGVVEIASVVVGAVMERAINNEGDITWELDQLRGFKHPNDQAPNPLPPAADGPVIRLTDWPKVENHLGDEISAGFEINWQYNGRSVGNVMISNVATNDAVGWGLVVKAKIMDDNIVYPRDNPSFAAIRVRLEYRFTRAIGGDMIAIRDVHLFGNGRYNLSGRWEQT